VEVDVDDASSGDDPAEIEVEEVNTINKSLIYAWKGDVCHHGELWPNHWVKGGSLVL